jgi:hypothetical protein
VRGSKVASVAGIFELLAVMLFRREADEKSVW